MNKIDFQLSGVRSKTVMGAFLSCSEYIGTEP